MSVDEGAAGRRLPRSALSPVHPVVSHLTDGGVAVQEKCPSCKRWRIYLCEPVDACCDDDHVAAFTPTHAADPEHDDSSYITTINTNYGHNGAAHADEYYRPALNVTVISGGRTVDPRDLGV